MNFDNYIPFYIKLLLNVLQCCLESILKSLYLKDFETSFERQIKQFLVKLCI